jgi:ATP adenylyltransferase
VDRIDNLLVPGALHRSLLRTTKAALEWGALRPIETRQLVVPRVDEFFRGISVNALGFAGSLFVKDRSQLELVRAQGPMQFLSAVAGSR